MSWLGDVLKFENFNLANQWGKLKENPERAFIGAMDKGGSLAWNKIYKLGGINKRYEPMTDWYGGASDDSYAKAQNAGINTGPGRSMHNVAKAITSAYVGGYGASQLGAGAGGATGATESGVINPATGLDWSATGSGYAGNGGYVSGGMGAGGSAGVGAGSTAPYGGDSQYIAQDMMEQARSTSAPSGSPQAWDTGDKSSGLSFLQRQLLARGLMNMGGGGQRQQAQNIDIIESQNPYLPMVQPQPIQTEQPNRNKLANALRNYYG